MSHAPHLPGWRHASSGKVRELYADPEDDSVLLLVATDRISAFDHVLSTPIPDKGRVLTAMSLWWFERLAGLVPHHLLSVPEPSAPDGPGGRSGGVPAAVAGRAMVCRRLQMYPVECVARGYLTGSGLLDYQHSGRVCGIPLPPGLQDGSRLATPIFTPATKADVGAHDENISLDDVAAAVGAQTATRLRDLTLQVYAEAERVAGRRGIVLADTKLEFGLDPSTHATTLGDEVLTPDSSRFWPAEHWKPGRPQPSFDKQYVRDWLTSPESGWDRSSEEPPPPLPEAVVERTRSRYVEAYERLTGRGFG